MDEIPLQRYSREETLAAEARLKEKRRLLINVIQKAFTDTPYPGDDNIGYSTTDFDGIRHTEVLRGKHWKEISLEIIQPIDLSLYFVTDDAFVFYLPAFLLASLEADADSVYDHVMFVLTLPSDTSSYAPLFRRIVAILSMAQKEAIRSYLEYRSYETTEYDKIWGESSENDAQQALDSYWGTESTDV